MANAQEESGGGRGGGAAGVYVMGVPLVVAAKSAPITVCARGCDYTTIQDAIDNAPNGATIKISTGLYAAFKVPDTDSSLTHVTLQGAGAGRTKVSATGSPVAGIDSGTVSIDGMTITGGTVGIYHRNGSGGRVTVDNSKVTDNSSGGIENLGGAMTLTHTTVTGNSAVDYESH